MSTDIYKAVARISRCSKHWCYKVLTCYSGGEITSKYILTQVVVIGAKIKIKQSKGTERRK